MLAGAAAAILLQVSDPEIAQVIDRHSRFGDRPMARLKATAGYLCRMAFGCKHEMIHAANIVHETHARVAREAPVIQKHSLIIWVASTIYHVNISLYEDMFGALDVDTANAILSEYSILARSQGVPKELWHEDCVAFRKYWHDNINQVEVTDAAKSVARDLLFNNRAHWTIRVMLPLARLLTAGLLPPNVSKAYSMELSGARKMWFKFLMKIIRVVYPLIPRCVRTCPMRYCTTVLGLHGSRCDIHNQLALDGVIPLGSATDLDSL